jgi:hypothetical protein
MVAQGRIMAEDIQYYPQTWEKIKYLTWLSTGTGDWRTNLYLWSLFLILGGLLFFLASFRALNLRGLASALAGKERVRPSSLILAAAGLLITALVWGAGLIASGVVTGEGAPGPGRWENWFPMNLIPVGYAALFASPLHTPVFIWSLTGALFLALTLRSSRGVPFLATAFYGCLLGAAGGDCLVQAGINAAGALQPLKHAFRMDLIHPGQAAVAVISITAATGFLHGSFLTLFGFDRGACVKTPRNCWQIALMALAALALAAPFALPPALKAARIVSGFPEHTNEKKPVIKRQLVPLLGGDLLPLDVPEDCVGTRGARLEQKYQRIWDGPFSAASPDAYVFLSQRAIASWDEQSVLRLILEWSERSLCLSYAPMSLASYFAFANADPSYLPFVDRLSDSKVNYIPDRWAYRLKRVRMRIEGKPVPRRKNEDSPLVNNGTITGRVLQEGKPVSGISVRLLVESSYGYWWGLPRHTWEHAAPAAINDWRSRNDRFASLQRLAAAPREPESHVLRYLPIIVTRTGKDGSFTFRHLTEGVYIPVVMTDRVSESVDVEPEHAGRLTCRWKAPGDTVPRNNIVTAFCEDGKRVVAKRSVPGYVTVTEKNRSIDIGSIEVITGKAKLIRSAVEEN